MSRTLTTAQHSKLDKLAYEEEGTVVVAWHASDQRLSDVGPIIRRSANGEPRYDQAAFRFIDVHGHLKPLSRTALTEKGLL